MIAAGYYLFSKQLHANRRPSRIRDESREFKNAMEKILDPATNMSATHYFYLMFASGQIMQLAEDNKLAPADDDNYQYNRWLQLICHSNSPSLLAASFDGIFHVAVTADLANRMAEDEKDSTGRGRKHEALMSYVPRLGRIFAAFTEGPPGITYDPYQKKYKGDFLKFVSLNLGAVDPAYELTNSALGQVIKRALAESRRFGGLPGGRASVRTNRAQKSKRSQGRRTRKNRNPRNKL